MHVKADVPVPAPPCREQRTGGIHLFVLVHGFQGTAANMKNMKNNILLIYPDSLVICSNVNERNTSEDIPLMGYRLADEIRRYMKENCPGTMLSKMSFIGYSMGGILIRESLKHLYDYKDKMHMYMSLSSPHLG